MHIENSFQLATDLNNDYSKGFYDAWIIRYESYGMTQTVLLIRKCWKNLRSSDFVTEVPRFIHLSLLYSRTSSIPGWSASHQPCSSRSLQSRSSSEFYTKPVGNLIYFTIKFTLFQRIVLIMNSFLCKLHKNHQKSKTNLLLSH